jgi:PST family polysaccharide transporter
MKNNRQLFIHGVSYIAMANYSGIIINLVITAMLARILSPSAFGVVAVANVFIVFFSLFADMGIGPAIIQFKDLQEDDIGGIFGFSFWLGMGLGIIFFLAAPVIAEIYNENSLIVICRILSLQILFVTLNVVPNSTLLKLKKFKIIAIRRVSIQVCCGIMAVLSVKKVGIYSLLISPVIGSIVEFFVNFWFSGIKVKFLPDFRPLRKIFSYSLFQFLFNFLQYFARNLDKLLIGKVLNLSQLGYYEKSYKLVLLPVQNIAGVITPVLHPILSDFKKDAVYNTYIKMTRMLANIAFPVTAILFFSAKELILLIFGSQWEGAIIPFRILSISVVTQMLMASGGSIYQAVNKTNILFISGFINQFITVFGFLITIMFFPSVEAVSTTFTIITFIGFFVAYYALVHVTFHKSMMKALGIFLSPLMLFCVQFVVLYVVSVNLNTGLVVSLLAKAAVWLILTLVYFQFFTEFKPKDILRKLFLQVRRLER